MNRTPELTPGAVDGKSNDLSPGSIDKVLLWQVLHVDDGCTSGEDTRGRTVGDRSEGGVHVAVRHLRRVVDGLSWVVRAGSACIRVDWGLWWWLTIHGSADVPGGAVQ